MRPRISSLIIAPNTSIRSVMQVIDAATKVRPDPPPAGIALVCDVQGILHGVVTDGDIRRAVLAGRSVDEAVSSIMNTQPITLLAGTPPATMLRLINQKLAARGATGARVERVVITNEKNEPVDIVSAFELWRESEVGARRVCVIGLGFVGLTLAVTFADADFEVIGIEKNKAVLADLERAQPHFHEKNLPSLLKKYVGSRMQLADSLTEAAADIYIMCVGTPINELTEEVNYSHIEQAAEEIGRVLKVGDQVILRSTVTIGTTRSRVIPLLEKISGFHAGRDFSVAFAPERTVEGKALEELRTLPQVIGGYDERSADLATRLFRAIAPTIVAAKSLEAAEMVKLINNSFRDHIFAFSNHVSLVCDKLGLSTAAIIKAANEGYPRDRIPRPSPGVGGICLRKDPLLFAESARAAGVDPFLARAAREINMSLPDRIAEKLSQFAGAKYLSIPTMPIGFLGVAFKGIPETSDIRGSVTLDVLRALRLRGFAGEFFAHDPLVSHTDMQSAGLTPVSLEDIFDRTVAVFLLTNHHTYETLDFDILLKGSPVQYLFDGWHLHAAHTVRSHGIHYDALGIER